MTATDDCNMIAYIILNLLAMPIAIKMCIDLYPYLIGKAMNMPIFLSQMNNILFGFGVLFLCGMIMGFGNWIDSIDLV